MHADEKWFFMTEERLRIYLTEGEMGPIRRLRHKSHIQKVMSLCAVARPRLDALGNCTFDGKIGMWPFVNQVAAQRASVS